MVSTNSFQSLTHCYQRGNLRAIPLLCSPHSFSLIAIPGKSFELNRSIIGDEPHWDDVARDIVHMINVFQERIQPPIICIGQSWGGYPAVSAALLHPRLFAAVVALEPLLITASLSPDQPGFPWTTAKLMARRRDTWKSKEEARTRLLAGAYFQAFDKDVFDKVMETDLRRTGNGEEVTLVTPKAQEVLTMMRLEESEKRRAWTDMTGRLDQLIGPGFYRAEPAEVAKRLGAVRPAVCMSLLQNRK
jgi:pimeloyl-ACP methyl ester carboxylesterase